jgi:GTP pyrophosphokinase
MKEKKLSFKELTDVFGVRIMTESVDDCYRVLGVMHNLYKPLPGKFKDYLAIPKTNGYQSLHSSLFGPHGVAIEVQIRTVEMDHFAESGIAAHWIYKEGGSDAPNTQGRALEWLKNLLEMQQKSGSSQEFLESVKVDLFPDEVYVFTPKGAIKKLPRGATVVDFAYAVHTDVGNTCVAARIDHQMSPLSSRLYNGQTVEIITSQASRPHPSWLDFVSTAKARTNIRHFLKSLQKIKVLEQYHMSDQKELLAEIGLGNRNSSLVAKAMYDIEEDTTSFDDRGRPLAIKGTEGMVVSFAKCCRPVPGDAIAGFMSSGKGIVIHQRSCPNMTELNKGDRQLSVQWSEHVEGEYLANMRVQVANQRGVLATLATTISNMSSNIEHVNVTEKDGRISTVEFVVTVKDRIHLARIMKKLRSLMVVNRIWRR